MSLLLITEKSAPLVAFIQQHAPLVVISGAGCSTASGIGDYRDKNGEWKRAAPIEHQPFVTKAEVQKRYWLRSMYGWPSFSHARPNGAHYGIAKLEQLGLVTSVITQNVDGLHQRAGQRDVIDLHGRLHWVVCLQCERRISRERVQRWLVLNNQQFTGLESHSAPDGDADLAIAHDSTDQLAAFQVPQCEQCGGLLKPDVVFYGGSVPPPVVQAAYARVQAAQGVLVVGTSLMVFSSFRFLRKAQQLNKPSASVNIGKTRADAWLAPKVCAPCDQILPAVCALLGSPLDIASAG